MVAHPLMQTATATFTNNPASEAITRDRYVLWYTSAISILGVILVGAALQHIPQHGYGLALFAVIAAGAELLRVQLFTSSRFSSVSVSGIVAMASIVAFGPLAGAVTHLASGLMTAVTTSLNRDKPVGQRASWIRRSVFNISMWVTSSSIAGYLFVWAGGSIGHITSTSNILPLTLAAGADVIINLVILIGVIALQTGRNPLHIWRQDFQWAVPIVVAGGVLGGGALALAHEMLGVLGVTVFCLPILTISYSFRLYSRNLRSSINKLEEMNSKLDGANLGLLEMLGRVIDADDTYTYGHSKQVSIYSGAIAEKMNLSKEEQERIIRAALIHDIGKIGISDSIISKQGPLTDLEYSTMKLHPVIGAEIVGQMEALQELVPIVRHHHERWDGRGYPDRLSSTDIPLGARIMALADTLDAMCSDRPYRPTRSFQEVKADIGRCSGTQFDPTVVNAFYAVVDEKGQDPNFFKNSATTVDNSISESGVGLTSVANRYLKRSMMIDPSDAP